MKSGSTLPLIALACLVAAIPSPALSARAAGPAGDAGLVPGSPPVLRLAAEWEPALGVLVAWPPFIPHALLREISRDSHLFVMVANPEREAEARDWFDTWGIAETDVTLLHIPLSNDGPWTRDWGPPALFDAQGRMHLVDPNYGMSTPTSEIACEAELSVPFDGGWGEEFADWKVDKDDDAPRLLAATLGFGHLPLEFSLTGGNCLTDGHGGALSTCILLNENRFLGFDEERYREEAARLLGLVRHQIIPNFEPYGIQHIDCLLKILDERRLLVARPPAGHPLSEPYERLVEEELSRLRNGHGDPWEILRIDTAPFRHDDPAVEDWARDDLTAYTNSLILNDVVYVPMYGIEQDSIALSQWRAALPGHRIKGIPFIAAGEPVLHPNSSLYDGTTGWESDDALHCRTRAIWDPEMLWVSLESIGPVSEDSADSLGVTARIVPHSGALLVRNSLLVHWRNTGESGWTSVSLTRGPDGLFQTRIPTPSGTALELYLSARDTEGRSETAPRWAPGNAYRYCY